MKFHSLKTRFYSEDNDLFCIVSEPNAVLYDAPVKGSGHNRKTMRRAIRKAYGKSVRFI